MNYFDNDFNFDDWKAECSSSLNKLPQISESKSESNPSVEWNNFFNAHNRGDFFKKREYLIHEFSQWLHRAAVVMEVGCGYGIY